jgi:hypothetical protein
MKTKSTITAVILSAVSFLVVLILGSPRAQAQGGIPLWTNRYHGPTNSYSEAKAMVVDGDGNVFVTGYLGVVVSNLVVGDHVDFDYVTIKYSNAGVPLWTNRYAGPGNGWDDPCCIAVDSSGDVIVTGISDHSGYNSSHTNFDYATIKYSNAGVPLWTNRYDGPTNGFDGPRAVAADPGSNVFVTGDSMGVGTGYIDYATIKYSNAGVLLWENRFNVPTYDLAAPKALAVASNGNVFVTVGVQKTPVSSEGGSATLAYSSSGVLLWTHLFDGPGAAIAVDSSGNAFVTGSAISTNINNSTDATTIGYSGAGVPLWTNLYNGPADYWDGANAVAVDGSGNVFVTGWSQTSSNGSSSDFMTIKYSSVSPQPVHLTIERDGGHGYFIRYHASPGSTNRLQRTASVTGPWSNRATNTAPASGLIEYHETNPPASEQFYRTVQP